MGRHGIIALILCFILPAGCAHLKSDNTIAYNTGPGLRSLKAEAVVQVFGNDSLKGRATILLKSPDKFRIEVHGAFEQTIMAIVSSGGIIETYSNGDTRSYLPVKDINPYPFTPQELVSALLLGEMPGKGADYRITQDSRGFAKKIEKLSEPFTIEYRDPRTMNGIYLPFFTVISYGYERIEIKYLSVITDPDIEDSAFYLDSARFKQKNKN